MNMYMNMYVISTAEVKNVYNVHTMYLNVYVVHIYLYPFLYTL